MPVPLLDLKAQYLPLKDEIAAAFTDVCETQRFIMGPVVEGLEADVCAYTGASHAVGVSSGTDALVAALMVAGVRAGDEVIVPTYTFFATAGSVYRLGATPVFVDVEADTLNVSAAAIEAAITSKTRAIIPVHLFGQCADMDPIMELASRHDLIVIEDAAQAIGAEYKGRQAGTMGHYGCFSFFPSKNLGCFGDGGMVVTNDTATATLLQQYRMHGSYPKYYHKHVGGNFRLDALQAGILRVKLPRLDAWHQGRVANAAWYDEAFAELDLQGLALPTVAATTTRHIFNQYNLRTPHRDRLQAHLKAAGVGCEIYYPLPLHLQECFAEFGGKPGDCPNAEAAAAESLAIPVYPELTIEQRSEVVEAIRSCLAQV
ncbi:MAG TPA: transcriptional regulator [Lentisphaeria bacterium]|jgi:dTDP-4-amino-4,6-dideoxygalactose transaminase|nr:transcriptional regulator [Lentisphaeria bacterium]